MDNSTKRLPNDDLIFTTAHELAAAIRTRRMSAQEVVEVHLDPNECTRT